MGERQQITYMQVRIVRLACHRLCLSLAEVVALFNSCDVFGYIERNFGLFHMEGDDAVFDDVVAYMDRKGALPHGAA